MMTSKDCAEAWKEVVQIYNSTRSGKPSDTMTKHVILQKIAKMLKMLYAVGEVDSHEKYNYC